MVGLVIVSHSPYISKGLVQMLEEAQPEVTVMDAGGTDDGDMGTSAMRIQTAIEKAEAGEGVVVLVDFGSSVMNAEMAIEMIETESDIMIADAPLIEGAYSAVMEAGFGKSLEEVVNAATSAKDTKKVQ
ncbi:dihydroxyacetone kinase phosphoryl donor subunit DhaM [Guptibacillus hwajinpoensis]|uniref:phosphoenolpyruvate--glycerone phosphotransferase n=1 Tax=Guptibacillus hwajinpoensis TaxID=208199 RepID=A0ABU0K8D0_9BACL|nr:dihydroxyacetone kinase phosphoryl donor subunit DhaM [Alkalihalobacillus hemicentroti]MDQ0484554.1 dihydroxyacetone kinase phosphotransfer subunit [Alkalihalobacillus hemicentroti]